MMNKKIAFFAAAFSLVLPLAPSFALADDAATSTPAETTTTQTANQTMRAQWEAQRQQNQQLRQQNQTERTGIKEQRQQNQQTRCQNIQTRIGDRINKFQDNSKTFGTGLTNVQARLQQLSDKLASSTDVTQLNADIKTLGDKITKMKTDHDALLSALNDAKTAATTDCQATPPTNDFAAKIQAARTSALTVEKDRLDARSFFQTTIRPEIMAIRSKLASQKTTTDATTGSDTKSL